MTSGVPVGVQVDVLDTTTSACPSDFTRCVPEVHLPVAQGPFPLLGGGMVHPATAIGEVVCMLGAPPRRTLLFGLVAVAVPACMHFTCAPTWTRNPGMSAPPHVTTSAVWLIITCLPTSVIDAPLPLVM